MNQATPPSEAQQLADARIAMDQAIARIRELEGLVAHQREQIGILAQRLTDSASLAHANVTLWRLLEAARGERGVSALVARIEKLDRVNDDLAAEHELLRHAASEARIDAQAANNAMYCAIERERAAASEVFSLRRELHLANCALAERGREGT